jgi:hypothetical protein
MSYTALWWTIGIQTIVIIVYDILLRGAKKAGAKQAVKELTKVEVVATSLNDLAKQVHDLSSSKGWWDDQKDSEGVLIYDEVCEQVPLKLVLIHSETSEAVEVYRETKDLAELRKSKFVLDKNGAMKPVGFDSEISDVLIRALDLTHALGIDIDKAVSDKHAYNQTRAHRHGGKRA